MRVPYIALEGIDHAGKSTQISLIHKFLMKEYFPFIRIREPQDPYIMKAVRSVNGYKFKYEKEALALLFSADRILAINNIAWAEDRSFGILSDRSVVSSLAYQDNSEWVRVLNKFAPIPDLIIWIDIGVEEALKRSISDNPFEQEESLKRARENYEDIYKSGEFNIKRINGEQDIENVTEEIKEIVGGFLDDKN